MIKSTCVVVGLVVLVALVPLSCTSVQFMEDIDDYEGAIEELQQQRARNPQDPKPIRDLGIIYLRTNDFSKANELLQLAFSRDPDDPKTLFHLGLANESIGKHDTALGLYTRYRELSILNPYRRLMAGRYAHVLRRSTRDAMRARLADEARIAPTTEPRIVAVYPLVYQGSEDRYAALGRGLAEFMTIDLGHVNQLQLVERVRLQELLDEINIAQGDHFDPSTAPRVGRLVGAGRLVGGVYDIDGGDMQLSAAMWEVERADIEDLGLSTGALSVILQLQKQLVFRVIDAMGIELTEEERRNIEYIPTQNLQAFLAFSRGLESEDAGAFDPAGAYYEQALQLDPNFREARDRADEARGQAAVSGPVSVALAAAFQEDPAPALASQPSVDPMAIHLLNLNTNLGLFLVPGLDARTPAVEGGTMIDMTVDELPDPPPPPGGN